MRTIRVKYVDNPYIKDRVYEMDDDLYGIADELDSDYGLTFMDDFKESLDDCFGDAEICGSTYSASHAFESVDPIAFRCEYVNHLDYLGSEIKDSLNAGDVYHIGDIIISEESNEEEDEESE